MMLTSVTGQLTDRITERLTGYTGKEEQAPAVYRLAYWMGQDPVLCEEVQELVNLLSEKGEQSCWV